MNWAAILAAARRAQAAYIEDAGQAQAAFEALGHTFLGQYQNASHQAVVSLAGGEVCLSISGTRFGQSLGDLMSDINLDLIDVGDGAKVTQGAYEGLADMWAWAQSKADAGAVFNVEGHSLGAWRTYYTPLFLPRERIGRTHCFESPKAANAAFWNRYGLPDTVSTVNGSDIWFGYPFLGDDVIQRPADHIWLKSTGFQIISPTQWPRGFSPSDHSIDLVVQRIEAISAANG